MASKSLSFITIAYYINFRGRWSIFDEAGRTPTPIGRLGAPSSVTKKSYFWVGQCLPVLGHPITRILLFFDFLRIANSPMGRIVEQPYLKIIV